jgi:hypothetical protein
VNRKESAKRRFNRLIALANPNCQAKLIGRRRSRSEPGNKHPHANLGPEPPASKKAQIVIESVLLLQSTRAIRQKGELRMTKWEGACVNASGATISQG